VGVVGGRETPGNREVSRMLKTMTAFLCGLCASVASAEDLGQLSANPYAPNSTANPFSPAGSPYSSTSVKNPYGAYGSPYSNQSVTNSYATDAPKLYDSQGQYRGKLSSNPYDPDSVSSPYGRYGSKYSADSINNRYGAGNPYSSDSPTNPYGSGWAIKSDDDSIVTAPRYTPSVPRYVPPKYTPPVPSYSRPSSAGYHLPSYGLQPTAADPWQVLGDPDGERYEGVARSTADCG
jgi:hypothetical protein